MEIWWKNNDVLFVWKANTNLCDSSRVLLVTVLLFAFANFLHLVNDVYLSLFPIWNFCSRLWKLFDPLRLQVVIFLIDLYVELVFSYIFLYYYDNFFLCISVLVKINVILYAAVFLWSFKYEGKLKLQLWSLLIHLCTYFERKCKENLLNHKLNFLRSSGVRVRYTYAQKK